MNDMRPVADLRLMMVGSLPPPIGGTAVSFELLCNYVSANAHCVVIDTSRHGQNWLRVGLKTIVAVFQHLSSVDVVTVHFSDRAAITFAPILWLICRLAGKPIVYRQFGGQLDQTFVRLSRLHRWWLRKTILRSDAVLFQTKSLIAAFRDHADHLHWFPTARKRSDAQYRAHFANGESKVLRCLYLGHVRRPKGVIAAMEAIGQVAEAELDIIGPLVDISPSELTAPRIRYLGPVPPEHVSSVMIEYDVLLFPTIYPGEGYSGTLVEAAMVGLPIIVSRWQSLPEMFSPDEVAFIEPGSAGDIAFILRKMISDPCSLARYSKLLRTRAGDFDMNVVFSRFLDICGTLANRPGREG